ncbi:MAG: PAS domain S-box protein [Acidobacteria bacterium]|nr:PAS domain S-box protein [Acidobacteriota bacterium]NIM60139.1 PAS domain S-box protein [Acidobacteriota bacterium]NIO57808.1 PAS domain S-box protein [Acidobacteriota bacterium]NIQ28817.1 PAS domain S-box protein [Acidobacteriota bacterium]NIQ83275.1 PAS domain S-box protein [Acidobacteriota bacterium]
MTEIQRTSTPEEDAARWSAVFDAVVHGVVTVDREGIIRSANQACQLMFGWTEGELVGHNCSLLMPSPDRENHDGYIKHYLKTGQRKIIGIGREVLAQRKDGSKFPIHLSVGEFRSAAGLGFVAILHDISAQRRAEENARVHRERLERMDRISLAGEMASGIAHEVNQPLSAIANYSRALLHMLGTVTDNSEDLRSTVDKIRIQSHRAGEIVRRMRDFVSRHETEPSPTSINEVVDEVLSLAHLSFGPTLVKLDTDLEKNLPDVLFDRVQLQQVILNLVNNAVEAIGVGTTGAVTIRTFSESPSTITLHVVDDGPGIPPEIEDRLFEPFFSNKHHGTGMGLAISRSIVEAQGGTLGFVRNPTAGVTFYAQFHAMRPEGEEDE